MDTILFNNHDILDFTSDIGIIETTWRELDVCDVSKILLKVY